MNAEVIDVKHENGYSGKLYGKSSMSIFKDGKEVLHTGTRAINTETELYEQLSEMPQFMEMLNGILTEIEDETGDMKKCSDCKYDKETLIEHCTERI